MVTNCVFSVGLVKVGWLLVPVELLFGVALPKSYTTPF